MEISCDEEPELDEAVAVVISVVVAGAIAEVVGTGVADSVVT